MPEENSEIEIRSDEVQEILSGVPSWMVRWGITLIFVIIIMFVTLCYFIKYPDVINGTFKLTTKVPPAKLVVKTSGEIDAIYIEDKEKVKAGDPIAQIRNPLTEDAIAYLADKVTEVEEKLEVSFAEPVQFSEGEYVFGALQTDYNELVKSVNEYCLNLDTEWYEKRKSNLQKQIANYRKLDEIGARQLKYAEEDFDQSIDKYNSNKELYDKGVISKIEFYNEERAYTQAKNEIENLKKNKVQNEITLTDYERQLNELEFNFLSQQTNLTDRITAYIESIRNGITSWQESYILKAPIDGTLNYLSVITKHQFIGQGTALFAVVPDKANDYVGFVEIDKRGYGKIEIGQEVRMQMDNFPSAEYGQLSGVVEQISLIPNEEKYRVEVRLTDGLTSTYKKELVYTPEMSGQASIVTEDLRILERIFNQFRKLFEDQ